MSINPKLLSRLAIVPPASAALAGLVVLAGRWSGSCLHFM